MFTYARLAIAAGVLAALIGAFFYGVSVGKAQRDAKAARVMTKALKAIELQRDRIDALSGAVAASQTAQQTETRVIYNEAVKIVERQSRAPCVDAGGLSLLDRAATNANRQLAFSPAGSATGATQDAP